MSAANTAPDGPQISIWGVLVALGPVDRSLLPLLVAWENDALVAHLSGDPVRPTTAETMTAAYERHARGEPPDSLRFALYERAMLRPIGIVDLRGIEHAGGAAEFGISIGERDCWGKGYGTEATRLTLDYAFNTLGLRSLSLEVYDFNERGIAAYRRAGFREVGRRRGAHRAGGRAYDVVYMECLRAPCQEGPPKP